MENQEHIKGKLIIAGGTGYIGTRLARHMRGQGWSVLVLGRSPPHGVPWEHASWDGRSLGPWARHLDGAAALVNLAGRSVDCVKTPERRDEILRSRLEATAVLGTALKQTRSPPSVWVQMSTAHIYGDPPQVVCDEDSPPGYGLAPFVGRSWEQAHHEALPSGMRSVILRTSFVLGRDSGALPRLARAARWGFGGTIGHGGQGISWIHEHDMDRLLERSIVDETMHGVYLATAPHPVSNRRFMRTLRRALRRPIGLPAAAWMIRLAAPLLLKTDPELALYGRYCISRRLEEEGFMFRFPELEPALRDLCRGRAGAPASAP